MRCVQQRRKEMEIEKSKLDAISQPRPPATGSSVSQGKRRRSVVKEDANSVKATKVKSVKPASQSSVKTRIKKTKLDFGSADY
jgi:hypothetical protein